MCPVKISKDQEFNNVSEIRLEIIKARNKAEVISILLRWGAQYGINSGTQPDDAWWTKRDKLGV